MATNTPAPYVSDDKLPDLAPPATTVGAIGWMKTNLFSSPLNTILTLVSIFLVFKMVPPIFNWAFVEGVWVADSRLGCEAKSDHGACWAVVVTRINQLIYGFYPNELQWRPNLAFIGMLVAIIPLLFEGSKQTRQIATVVVAALGVVCILAVGGGILYILGLVALIALIWAPRKWMIVFSCIYPVLAYFLLWGGSFWFVVGFFVAIAVGVIAYHLIKPILVKLLDEGPGGLFSLLASLLVIILGFRYGISAIDWALSSVLPFGLEPVESSKMGGFLLTVLIGVIGIVGSLPLGILLALGRQSDMLFIKSICVGFIEIIRGVPLITLLFVASTLLNYFLPPGTTFDIILRVIIMVTLFASAYMAEVVRGGLAALPKGQYEAADALGLDYNKSMRLIIMPQALKISIPGIVNTFIGLFKDTTLVSIIGLLDPLGLVLSIQSDIKWGGTAEEIYIFVALVFFIFCFSMSRYSMYLERKLQTGHR